MEFGLALDIGSNVDNAQSRTEVKKKNRFQEREGKKNMAKIKLFFLNRCTLLRMDDNQVMTM